MDPNITLKVGDKIVDAGHIYRIFEVENHSKNGDNGRILHFRPYYNLDQTKDVVCSIPESNIIGTRIRLPLAKRVIQDLLNRLSIKPKYTEVPDVQSIKELLNENDLEKAVDIMRILWAEKRKGEGFTKSKSDTLEIAKSQLVQEVALVFGLQLEKANRKVELALDRPYK